MSRSPWMGESDDFSTIALSRSRLSLFNELLERFILGRNLPTFVNVKGGAGSFRIGAR